MISSYHRNLTLTLGAKRLLQFSPLRSCHRVLVVAMFSSSLAVLSWLSPPSLGSGHFYILAAALPVLSLICAAIAVVLWKPELVQSVNDFVASFGKLFYSNFLKPHSSDQSFGQQAALESFYKVQV